jgi:hypothetical protein
VAGAKLGALVLSGGGPTATITGGRRRSGGGSGPAVGDEAVGVPPRPRARPDGGTVLEEEEVRQQSDHAGHVAVRMTGHVLTQLHDDGSHLRTTLSQRGMHVSSHLDERLIGPLFLLGLY